MMTKVLPTVCVIRMSLFGTSTPLRYWMIWHRRILGVIQSRERQCLHLAAGTGGM
jgi:hypothetical protein